MRIKNGKLVPGDNWYFEVPTTVAEPPVIDSTVAEAVVMIADAIGKSPSTVSAVAFVDYRSDGLVDVSAYGRLVRFNPATPREKRKAAKRLADQTTDDVDLTA